MIPGGLSEARPATPEIQELADAVKPQLEEQTNTTYREFTAEEYKTQVVAGINYFVKVNVGGGRYMHVKIFRGLSRQNQDLVLVGYQADKTKDDELTGF